MTLPDFWMCVQLVKQRQRLAAEAEQGQQRATRPRRAARQRRR